MCRRIRSDEAIIANANEIRPKRLPISEVAQHPINANAYYYVVKNLQRNRYVRMSEPYYRLFLSMDGITPLHCLCDEAFEAQKIPDEKTLRQFLHLLLDTGLIHWDIDETITQNISFEGTTWGRIATQAIYVTRRILGLSFSLKNSDRIAQRLHSLVGWIIRSKPGQIVVLCIITIGLVFAPTHVLLSILTVFSGQISNDMALTYFWLCMPLVIGSMVLHEAGHCIACKHYRRYVTAIGIRLIWGFPAPYVDTTDCWMLPRRKRIIVAAAGTMANGFLMGLSSMLILVCSNSEISYAAKLLFMINLGAIIINIIPFSQYDGYHILCDLLDEPGLRKTAKEYIGHPGRLWANFSRLRNLSRRDMILVAYGFASLLFNVAVISATVLILALIMHRAGLYGCAT